MHTCSVGTDMEPGPGDPKSPGALGPGPGPISVMAARTCIKGNQWAINRQYMILNICLHVYIYIYIRLFQSSSLLACRCNPPMASNPIPQYLPLLPSIQASKNLSILGCMDPSLHHLKGSALGPHRAPQRISGCKAFGIQASKHPWLHGSLIASS